MSVLTIISKSQNYLKLFSYFLIRTIIFDLEMLITNFCSILKCAVNFCNLKLFFFLNMKCISVSEKYLFSFTCFSLLCRAGKNFLECSAWVGHWNCVKWDLKHLLFANETCKSQCTTERWVVVKSIRSYSLVFLGTRDAKPA